MMTPLGSIFRTGANKPPKIDQHSLFTSIQVSAAVLQGDLQVYEPWKRKRSKPKECHVTLYVNETSPFLVWHKIEKGNKQVNAVVANIVPDDNPASPNATPKPRCVLPVSRAKLRKTTGGSFELTDFASSLTFRFVASTIKEAESWVKKLSSESLREAKLDMRSICSSCSSFSSSTSSFNSHTSPDSSPNEGGRFFPASNNGEREQNAKSRHRKSASFSDATGALMQLLNNGTPGRLQPITPEDGLEIPEESTPNLDVFAVKSTADHIAACKLGHVRSNSKTFPRVQASKAAAAARQQQQHMRAQPHLGIHVALDRHRPELRQARSTPTESPTEKPSPDFSTLPFSEFFVHVPST
uniref:Uncharacterized protein LOC100175398 n=1 Tax=Phallusia mammillata TaxID=59560 RepID=A0A6F9DH50_9ASCI|nr:uncharacterized protein LOC100175398 [Phallusia mammillata]